MAKKPVVIDFHAHIAVTQVLEKTFSHSQFAHSETLSRSHVGHEYPI